MAQKRVTVRDFKVGNDMPLTLISGPDSLESYDHAFFMAKSISDIAKSLNINYIFKASYDKANRTSVKSFRGVGLKEGMRIMRKLKSSLNISVTTDVHSPAEARIVGKVVDLVQVPALLSRQTDLLVAVGNTNKAVNIKKGQFIAPHDVKNVIEKVTSTGNKNVCITERGATFGYNDVIADMRGLEIMKRTGFPVVFDASHTVQFPSSRSTVSGGDRTLIPSISRAAVAVGIAGVFIEVHDKPEKALVDGPSSLSLGDLEVLLVDLLNIDKVVKKHE